MTSEQVIAEARAYADRLAKVHADRPQDREEYSNLAFIAFLQGFRAGIDCETQMLRKVVGHD